MESNQIDLVSVIRKIGWDNYETVCNVADYAINADGFTLDQRLTFAENCKDLFSLSAAELCKVFVFRLEGV